MSGLLDAINSLKKEGTNTETKEENLIPNNITPITPSITPTNTENTNELELLKKELQELKQLLTNNKPTETKVENKVDNKKNETDYMTKEEVLTFLNQQKEQMTRDFYFNNLSSSEKEYIKSIPNHENLSIPQVTAILNKSSIPKISQTVPVAKDENIDDVIKRIKGGK